MTRTRIGTHGAGHHERRDEGSREALRRRIQRQFDEQRGLGLTLPQARRLFHLRDDICRRVLHELVTRGGLTQAADGRFRRRDRA